MDIPALTPSSAPQLSDAANLRAAQTRKAKSPLVAFEAFVLQDFVAAMLPKEAENVNGKGLSGEMWQSMFAEKIATQMAERGGIGIADRLLKDFQVEGEEKLPLQGVSDPHVALKHDEPDALAKAMLHGLQTGVLGFNRPGAEPDAEGGS